MVSESGFRSSYQRKGAFTLIEVLVVVAIIALLVAILIPSLQRAREQAKIATCQANCKQIANIIASYRTEYKGYLPVIYNYGPGIGHYEGNSDFPARCHWFPIAFRTYSKGTRKLPPQFDPEGFWNEDIRQEFENTLMDDYYACPFEREKGGGEDTAYSDQTMRIRGITYRVQEWTGRHCSYHTWMWEGLLIRNEVVYSGAGPEPDMGGTGSGPRDGRPQYTALSWCYAKWGTAANQSEQYDQWAPPGSGQPPKGNKNAKMLNRHRKWALGDVRRVK
ncbi:MAG: type II secretion system protein, partial [Planctomycetota bacterium]